MTNQITSILRTTLKVAGGGLVAKGLTDESGLESLIGGFITLVGITWSYFQHKKKD